MEMWNDTDILENCQFLKRFNLEFLEHC
jgi:hypothetical protein